MKITYKGVTKECKYYKGLKWNKPLTAEMKKFERQTGKNAVYRGVVTGTFEYWKYWDPKKPSTKKYKKSKPIIKVTKKKTTVDIKPSKIRTTRIQNINLGSGIELRNVIKTELGKTTTYNFYIYKNGKIIDTTILEADDIEDLKYKIKTHSTYKVLFKPKKEISTSIQGGFNELTTPPEWLSRLPKSKRDFPHKLERSTGKYYYYRTYPEDKKQNAINLRNKKEKDNFKAMIKIHLIDDRKIYRVYKTRRKYIKPKGMKMQDIQKKKKKSLIKK